MAIVFGSLVYALFHSVPALRGVADWYAPNNNTILSLGNFTVLYFTFCKLDFRRMRPVRWHLHVALMQTALACLVLALAMLEGGGSNMALLLQAALVCIVAPTASASAVVTAKLGGDLEQMVTFTLLCNVLSAALIPLMLPHLPGAASAHDISQWQLAAEMLWRVVCILLMPMLVAWLTRYVAPSLHRRIVETRNLSFYAWAVSLAMVSGTAVKGVVDLWDITPLWLLLATAMVGLVVCIVQFFVGRRLGRLTNHRIECGQGLGQKNTTFAIWLSASFLHPLACLGPGCYILWQNLFNSWQLRCAEKARRKLTMYN